MRCAWWARPWDFRVDVALEIPRAENIDNIARSMEAIVAAEARSLVRCRAFLRRLSRQSRLCPGLPSARRWTRARNAIVLCDTNGGTMPEAAYAVVSEVKAKLPGANLGIHATNDTEQAVAVSLAAVRGRRASDPELP